MADLGAFGKVNLSQIGAIGNVDISKIGSIVEVQVVPDSISLNHSDVTFDGDGNVSAGSSIVQVTSSGSWTLTINYYSGSGWITTSKSSGSSGDTVRISVSYPYSYPERSGYIRFTVGTAHADFSVDQYGDVV